LSYSLPRLAIHIFRRIISFPSINCTFCLVVRIALRDRFLAGRDLLLLC
jgi:hypothetical protein